MMPEEIIALREEFWGRPGSQREKLVRALFKHIDELTSQNATLKAALISERNRYLVDFIHEYDDVRDCKEEAESQLAKEYPEIDWEE